MCVWKYVYFEDLNNVKRSSEQSFDHGVETFAINPRRK